MLVVAISTVLDIRRERSIFRYKEEQKGLFLATGLNDILANYIYMADVDALSDIGQLLADQPDIIDIEYFQVFDAKGRLLASADTNDYPVGYMQDELSQEAARTGAAVLRFNGDSLEFATPITAGSDVIGVVRYGFNTDALNAEIKEIIFQHIWQGLVVILIGLVLSHLIARYATRPLRALGEAAGHIGRGGLETPIPVGGPGETRQLGNSLESMRSELQALYTGLEQQVLERTRELTKTTEGLEAEVAERQLAEEGLRLRNQELETLLTIANILAGPGAFVQKATDVLDELSRLIQADWVTLRQAGGEKQSLYLVAKAGPATLESPPMLVLTERETLAATAYQQGETIVVNDYAELPEASPAIVALGMRSMVLLPLQAHGRRLGLINAVCRDKDHFTRERVRLFTAIGEGVGVLFENTRLSQELQAHMEELAVVDEVSRIISSTLDIDQVYDQFATEVNKLAPFDRASIQVIDHDSGTFTVRHLHGQIQTRVHAGDVVPLVGSHAEHSIASGRSEITADIAVDPRFLTDPDLIEAGLHSTLVVPLVSKGRVIASMMLSSRQIDAYGPREQAILERFASQIASAVENSILFAATVRLGVAVAAVGESICIMDLEGHIEFVNPALQELLGYEAADLIGLPISKLYPGGADNPVLQTITEALSTGTWSGEVELLGKNGNLLPTLEVATPMRERAGQVVGYVCVNTDLRERKRTEEDRRLLEVKALAQSKLASLGQVATGVAHEINQPLTYINTFIQALQEDLELKDLDPEQMKPRLWEALRQVSRIDNIVQHLGAFGRRDDTQMAPASLEAVLDNTLLLLGEHLRATNIEVERRIDAGLPPVMGNANQLEEVFINLFQNSADAFRGNQADAKICVDISKMPDEGALVVQFSDNVVGIAPAHLDRIFEPFFTTKEEGQGTGLGLSIIYGIITDHRGTITCESEYTKGTTISITLPVGEATNAKA